MKILVILLLIQVSVNSQIVQIDYGADGDVDISEKFYEWAVISMKGAKLDQKINFFIIFDFLIEFRTHGFSNILYYKQFFSKFNNF